MKEIIRDGVCPFCIENFDKYHKEPKIKETQYWILTKNDYPYEGAKIHLLLIHKKHLENLDKITPEASSDLMKLVSWSIKKFNIRGGSLFLRFGNMDYNGSSVAHLHAHLISGKKRSNKTESLKVKLAYK